MRFIVNIAGAATAAAVLSACATTPLKSGQDQFFASVSSHCGHSLHGRLVSNDPQDAAMNGKPIIGHFVGCTASEVRINIAVGDDTSRTWLISRTPGGLRLKHLQFHKDGTEAEVSRYGGDATTTGTAQRQEFPPDAFTSDLFTRVVSRPGNLTNVWAVEARPNDFYAHELRNATTGRFFRLELHRAPSSTPS
jgi:hypothetical protein